MCTRIGRINMTDFHLRHINRLKFPVKHVMIIEDDILNQYHILKHLMSIFEHQGDVQISIVPGSIMGAYIITNCKVDLIILDHDTPYGNGVDLLNFLRDTNLKIPVITFSGIEGNNDNLMTHGANYKFYKHEVINGLADDIIRKILFESEKEE